LADTYHGNIEAAVQGNRNMRIYLAGKKEELRSAVEGNRNMRIYMSPALNWSTGQITVEETGKRLKFLTSYYYYQNFEMETIFGKPQPALMADSGAFSAASTGASISLAEYAEWVKRWEPLFDHYANLDVIGDPEATLRNQRELEDMGLRPMPVFHVGSPWEYLERYLDEYDYIALGGMVPYVMQKKNLIPWIIRAFKMLTAGKGYHGFGTTGWDIMSSFPWWSVDSSSWAAGYMFGQGIIFSRVKGGFVKFRVKDIHSCFALRREFAKYGYDWREFAEPTDNPLFGVKSALRRKLCAVSARAYLEAEDWMTKRHGSSQMYLAHPVAAGMYGMQGLREGEEID